MLATKVIPPAKTSGRGGARAGAGRPRVRVVLTPPASVLADLGALALAQHTTAERLATRVLSEWVRANAHAARTYENVRNQRRLGDEW